MSSPKIRAGQYIGNGCGGTVTEVRNNNGIINVTIQHVGGQTTCFLMQKTKIKELYKFVKVLMR